MANLIDVARQLGTDEACLNYLEAARWPEGVACLKCGSLKVSKTVSDVKATGRGRVPKGTVTGKRYLYDCGEPECRHQFSATTGTIFHDSHLSLTKWFLAVALFCDAKKSISASQLQRHLGLGSYKTAWHLAHRIRRAMEAGADETPFGGVVEADETYIGGRFDKRRKRAKCQKAPVVGVLQRATEDEHSKVRAFSVKRATSERITAVVRDNVSRDVEMLCTDESNRYHTLGGEYPREVVNHIVKQYVRRGSTGMVTTNGIENFWSLFKRGLVGSFHQVSVKHLGRYLDEFTYRFNHRHAEDLFGRTVVRMANAERLPFADLTATE